MSEKNKSFEQVYKEFKRNSKEKMDELKRRSHYKKPSEIKREKINKQKKRKRKNDMEYNDKNDEE